MSFHDAMREWRRQNDDWAASDRRFPDSDWWQALDNLVNTLRDANNLDTFQYPAAAQLMREYMAWSYLSQHQAPPPDDLMRAVIILEQAQPREYRKTETWYELWGLPGMRAEQVAKMKGCTIRQAEAARAALQNRREGLPYDEEALKEPAETPEERERAEQQIREAKEYKKAVEEFEQFTQDMEHLATAAEDDFVPPPESIEELMASGVSDQQIAQMHRVPISTVEAIRRGESHPPIPEGRQTAPLGSATAVADPPANPLANRPKAEIDADIRELLEALPDATDADIADAVGCTEEYVKQVIANGT